MAPGAKIDFILAETPSTGFSWNIDRASAEGTWTVLSEEHVRATEESHDRMAVPGVKKITLRMGEEGTSMFRIVQSRSWEFKGWAEWKKTDEVNLSVRDFIQF